MIDVHSHVLPGIDDGTKELDEAIDFCRLARERGTEVLVATPHHKPGSYSNPRERILERIADLQKRVDAAGIPLRLAPGCEIFVEGDLAAQVRSGALLTYGDVGRYILLEFSFQQYPVRPEDLIFSLRLASITPVIAHPERIRYFQDDPDRLEKLVRLGALAQVTASSLTGLWGSRIKALTEQMILRRCAHLLASDSHDLTYRPPGLNRALDRASHLVGADAAILMVRDRPAALLEGREILVPEPVPLAEVSRSRGGLSGLLRRLIAPSRRPRPQVK